MAKAACRTQRTLSAALVFIFGLAPPPPQLRQGSEWQMSLSVGERSVGWRDSQHGYSPTEVAAPAAAQLNERQWRRSDLQRHTLDKAQADRCPSLHPATPKTDRVNDSANTRVREFLPTLNCCVRVCAHVVGSSTLNSKHRPCASVASTCPSGDVMWIYKHKDMLRLYARRHAL